MYLLCLLADLYARTYISVFRLEEFTAEKLYFFISYRMFPHFIVKDSILEQSVTAFERVMLYSKGGRLFPFEDPSKQASKQLVKKKTKKKNTSFPQQRSRKEGAF